MLRPDDDYLTGVWREHVYPLAAKMGFTMKQPPLQPRTRLAHAAAKWAGDQGGFAPFNRALFKAFFQDGWDIGRLDVLQTIAEISGLEPDGIESEEHLALHIERVLRDEDTAKRAGVRAVPAYVANGRVLAAGVQSLDRLRQLLSLSEN